MRGVCSKLLLVAVSCVVLTSVWGCRGDGIEEGDPETTFDILGTWSLSAGAYSGTLTVTSADITFSGSQTISVWNTSASFIGDYMDRIGGGVEWDIFVNWTVRFDGTIKSDNLMSGTWKDGQATGNWTATR